MPNKVVLAGLVALFIVCAAVARHGGVGAQPIPIDTSTPTQTPTNTPTPSGTRLPVGATPTVVATISVGSWPEGIAVDTQRNRIYVANWQGDSISVISGADNSVVATIPLAGGSKPIAVAANPITDLIYAADYGSNRVSVIDGTNNSVTATITVGGTPAGIAVNPSTNRIYVANNLDGTVSVINGATNSIVDTIDVGGIGSGPNCIAVNPTTNRIYVTKWGASNVSVIDGAANTLVTSVSMGANLWGVAVNPNTNRVYVASSGTNQVLVMDGGSNTVIGTISVGSNPVNLAVDSTANRVFVPDDNGNSVTVIDGSNVAFATLSVGNGPTAAAANPSTERIYVSNGGDNTVTVIQDYLLGGDLNLDGKVDILDLQEEAYHGFTKSGDQLYDPGYDVAPASPDGEIDVLDEQFVIGRLYSTSFHPIPTSLPPTPGPPVPTIRLNPESATVSYGVPVTVQVWLDGVTDLGAYEFTLSWDSSKLDYQTDTPDTALLQNGGRSADVFSQGQPFSFRLLTSGQFRVGSASRDDASGGIPAGRPGGSGSGKIWSFTLMPKTNGVAYFHLTNYLLADPFGQQIQTNLSQSAVGGLADAPEANGASRSSSPPYAAVAGLAALIGMFGLGGWYVRSRRRG